MKITFEKESKAYQRLEALYNLKENNLKKAISIIEEETCERIKEGSSIGYSFFSSFNYNYYPDEIYFENVDNQIPGYKKSKDSNGRVLFKIDGRTKIGKKIEDRFNKEIIPIDSVNLNEFGVFTEDTKAYQGRMHYYHWTLYQVEGTTYMNIDPRIYDLIDFCLAKDIVITK